MNVRRTYYTLMAVCKGHNTMSRLVKLTGLPRAAILRDVRDHGVRLGVEIKVVKVEDEIIIRLKDWGALDGNWMHANIDRITAELDFPKIETIPHAKCRALDDC